MILVGEGEDLEPPGRFLKREVQGTVLNLMGDYRFMTEGYYVSLHAEENCCEVYPPTKNALDAYRSPLFMKAILKLDLDIPEFEVVCRPKPEECILLPLNPFSKNSLKVVKTDNQYLKSFKKLSMNRYPVVQVRAEKIDFFTIYLTLSENGKYNAIAEKIFRNLKIPLGKVFVDISDGKAKPFYFIPIERKEIDFNLIFEVLENENCLLC